MVDLKATVERCQKGDRGAQKSLYEKLASKMLGVCIRYARDQSEAEDFLQEGFIKVFKNIHNLRNPLQVEGWIEKIMVNTALEHIRKKKTVNGYEVDLEDNVDVEEEEKVTDELSREELLSIIQELPDGFRAVFNMYAIEGFSHKEIAEKLSITEGTSKSQYARAKSILQQKVIKINNDILKDLS